MERVLTVARRAPAGWVWIVLVSAAAWLLAQDWIAAAGIWVLWMGWRYLRPDEGPPVLAMAFTFQWIQVTVGIYYNAVTGDRLGAQPVVDLADPRPMVLIGLGCLMALLVGLRAGMWGARWLGARPTVGPEHAFTGQTLLLLYVGSLVVTGTVQELAWRFPALTQGILALTYARFALLFLLFRRLSSPRIRWRWIATILAVEIVIGFTGYFAGFREPIMMAAIAAASTFDRRKAKHWLVLGALAAIAVVTGVLWMGVRTEYRRDFENQVFAESRQERLDRFAELTADWLDRPSGELLQDVRLFLERLWAVHYPALAYARVPAMTPHEDGAILWRSLAHLVTPRVLFPDKPLIESDSEMVFRYSGVLVAGAGPRVEREQGLTSIAFGYAAESYVDFGVPLMFLPVFVFGCLMGAIYRWLLTLVRHRELATGLVVVVFWLSLYLFERSWLKMLGGSVTLVVYLGGATLLLDRFLLWRKGVGRAWVLEHARGR